MNVDFWHHEDAITAAECGYKDFLSNMTVLGYAIATRGGRLAVFEAPDFEWARREWGSVAQYGVAPAGTGQRCGAANACHLHKHHTGQHQNWRGESW